MTSVTVTQDDLSSEEHENNQSSSSLTSDSSTDCPFNADIVSKLSTAFAKATGLEIECAMELLQEHRWNIDQALKASYATKEDLHTTSDCRISTEKYLKVLSWNTDTSDSDEVEMNDLIEQRVESMIEIFLREKPDVLLLQQVGTFALTLIITSLSEFYDDESIQIDPPTNGNYVSIFTRKSTVQKLNHCIVSNSDQWNMLKLEIEYRGSIPMMLFNAFIDEQTASFCLKHINQLKSNHLIISAISSQMFDDVWNEYTVDLDDLWETTGQQAETAYTLDPKLNSNIPEKEKPQRCDRLFYRFPTSIDYDLKTMHMQLEGLEHVKRSDHLFPSSHWAIEGFFQIDS